MENESSLNLDDAALKVLIVDDEVELRKSLKSLLTREMLGFQCNLYEAEDGKEALSLVKSSPFDLVLMDVCMPQMNGLEALRLIKDENPKIFVVIMTAHSNLKDAISAIKSGAYDYLEKPIDPKNLLEILKKAFDTQKMVSSLAISRPIFDEDIDSEFKNPKMRKVFDLVNKLSQTDAPVTIRGERGTHKAQVAKAIHCNSSRKHGEFVHINCKFMPNDKLESELFGHEKEAFDQNTQRKIGGLQLANNGTIFLDEIGGLSLQIQNKLLTILKDRSFIPLGGSRNIKTDARIIVSTEKNLEKLIEDDLYSLELLEKLDPMTIFMPPLRERPDDLYTIIKSIAKKISVLENMIAKDISDEAMKTLLYYSWPGNLEELEEVMKRSFLAEEGLKITVQNLPEYIRNEVIKSQEAHALVDKDGTMDFDKFKMESEKKFIINALKANQGKINKTVAHANIAKNTLLRKIKKYEIDVKKL